MQDLYPKRLTVRRCIPPSARTGQVVKLRHGQIYSENNVLQVVSEPDGRWVIMRPEEQTAAEIERLRWWVNFWCSIAGVSTGFLILLAALNVLL